MGKGCQGHGVPGDKLKASLRGIGLHVFCRTCGNPFHRKRVTPDFFGVNVHCLEGFDPEGIPVRATVGAGMP